MKNIQTGTEHKDSYCIIPGLLINECMVYGLREQLNPPLTIRTPRNIQKGAHSTVNLTPQYYILL